MDKLILFKVLGYFMAALAGLLFGSVVHMVLTAMAEDGFEIPAPLFWCAVILNACFAAVLFRILDNQYGPSSQIVDSPINQQGN